MNEKDKKLLQKHRPLTGRGLNEKQVHALIEALRAVLYAIPDPTFVEDGFTCYATSPEKTEAYRLIDALEGVLLK